MPFLVRDCLRMLRINPMTPSTSPASEAIKGANIHTGKESQFGNQLVNQTSNIQPGTMQTPIQNAVRAMRSARFFYMSSIGPSRYRAALTNAAKIVLLFSSLRKKNSGCHCTAQRKRFSGA